MRRIDTAAKGFNRSCWSRLDITRRLRPLPATHNPEVAGSNPVPTTTDNATLGLVLHYSSMFGAGLAVVGCCEAYRGMRAQLTAWRAPGEGGVPYGTTIFSDAVSLLGFASGPPFTVKSRRSVT